MKTDYRHEAVALGWSREKILEIDRLVIGRNNFQNRRLVKVNESTILYDNVDRCHEWRRLDVPHVPIHATNYRASVATRPTAAVSSPAGYPRPVRQPKPTERRRMDESGRKRKSEDPSQCRLDVAVKEM